MITQNQNGSLVTTIQNKIATIEFGHPASNSFTKELLHRFTNEIQDLGNNPAVTVIVVKSTGIGVFCAGASLNELLLVSNEAEGTVFFSGFADLINAMRTCPKIIIGRLQGKAVGGGVGIAAACDYVFATKTAFIKLSELAIGIGPFVIEPAVSRKIGITAMTELTLAAQEWKSADWAKEKGLYTHTFVKIEDLDHELTNFSTSIARYNPEALAEIKKVLWEGTEHWETLLQERAVISGKLILSEHSKKILAHFKK